MKKFVFYFILYIGWLIAVFNPVFVAAEPQALAQTESINREASSASGRSLPAPRPQRRLFKKFTTDLITFIAIPFVIDKLYPEDKINTDITPALQRFYPNTNPEKLESLGKFIKLFVSFKRRYDYVVTTLEQKVKASGIIPADAPVVAGDGEYASAYPDTRKQTPAGQYQVGYQPYKYVEYDMGELGEPVRRRDKNYAGRTANLDEITLALLKFDIPSFVRAIQKLPRQTDGSDEVSVINEHGVASRILLAVSAPGEKETIRGVIQLNIPQDYYITADFLNPRARPQFILSEDKDNSLNIKEYQLFLPEANGVVKDGIAKRILTGTVRYPIEFTRADVEKPMKIKGTFGFEMCHKDGGCQAIADAHELTLPPSLDEELSIYNNYVTQGFTHLPPEKSAHAALTGAIYNPERQELTLTFKTGKTFSNIAVIAEDAHGTNYINPRYTISSNEITATYHLPAEARSLNLLPPQGGGKGEGENQPSIPFPAAVPLAVTASFDNAENLRTTITPTISTIQSISHPAETRSLNLVPLEGGGKGEGENQPSIPPSLPLLFGLIIPLCPAIFYLFIRLINLMWTRPDSRRILFRYSLGTALGLTLLTALFHGKYWSLMYENAALTAIAGLVAVSMLTECTGQMDFALFRPLRGKLRRGFLIGLFAILLLTGFPMPLSAPVFSTAFAAPASAALKILALVWLGMQILPLAAFFFRPNAPYFLPAMQRLNIIYNLLYIFGVLSLIGVHRGEPAAWLAAALFALTYFFWRIYPEAIAETIKHTRSPSRQQQLFYKVQRLAAYIILCIALLAAAFTFFPKAPEPASAPLPAEIISRFRQTQKPILVTVTANWSPLTPVNSIALKRLPEDAAEVIVIPAVNTARAALPWLKVYNSLYAPLNILFTARHPDGLKLPHSLNNIDWPTALATFEPLKTERTPAND